MQLIAHYSDEQLIGDALSEIDRGTDFASAGTNYYSWYYTIGYIRRPRVVVEIGTRFGYSILSMFTSSESKERLEMVHCFDNESDVAGSIATASENFRAASIPHRITLANTQYMQSLQISGADICHIDGDHSESGCFHDCILGWETLSDGGCLIIDDAKFYPVAAGTSAFLLKVNRHAQFFPSLRGMYLVTK